MFPIAILTAWLMATPSLHGADDAQRAEDERIVGLILKMENFDLKKSGKAQAAVDRYLKANLGSDTFLELYKKFDIRDHDQQLLDAALAKPSASGGVAAARLLVQHGAIDKLLQATNAEDAKMAAAALHVLGRMGDQKTQASVGQAILEAHRPMVVRRGAIEGLGSHLDGQKLILKLAKEKPWDKALDGTAVSALILSTDENIRKQAGERFKLGGGKFAPIPELIQKKGDLTRGKAAVAAKGCIACHKVGDQGIDFGPALSEIGAKLPKAAMYTAILNPSAGVSMGFEGYTIELKSGGALVGMVTSSTDTTITVRMIGGINQTVPKDNLKSKKLMKMSLMPEGLGAAMTEQELVDMVEYLVSLKGSGKK